MHHLSGLDWEGAWEYMLDNIILSRRNAYVYIVVDPSFSPGKLQGGGSLFYRSRTFALIVFSPYYTQCFSYYRYACVMHNNPKDFKIYSTSRAHSRGICGLCVIENRWIAEINEANGNKTWFFYRCVFP